MINDNSFFCTLLVLSGRISKFPPSQKYCSSDTVYSRLIFVVRIYDHEIYIQRVKVYTVYILYRVLLPSIWPSSCLYTRLQGDSTMYSTVGNMYTKIIPQVVRRYVET